MQISRRGYMQRSILRYTFQCGLFARGSRRRWSRRKDTSGTSALGAADGGSYFFLSFWRGERDSENTESGGVEGAFLFYSDIEIARTEEKQAIYGYDVTANHPRRPCMGVPNCPAVIAPGQTPCPRSPTTAPRRERERERKTKNAFYEQPSPPLRPPPPPLTSASASQTPPNPPSSQHPAQTSSAHPSRPQTPRAPKIPPAPPAACSA